MGLMHTIGLAVTSLALLAVICWWITLSYAWPTRKPKRYVAKRTGEFIGVPIGYVEDTTPDQPTTLDRPDHGFVYVTTLSRARHIARWANRKEGD